MKLLHKTTITNKIGKDMPAVTLEYTDSPEVNKRVDEIYNNILQKYGYDTTIKTEIAQHKIDPTYGLEVVYDIEHHLYYHVKEQFMYNYGGLEKPKPTQMDIMLEQIKDRQGVNDSAKEYSNLFNARVELYTNIVVMFQEFGGIPTVSTN